MMIRRKPISIWTEELDAIVLQRWNDGESSGMIARAMNLSRNQVIGRLSRLGAMKRAAPHTRIKSAPGPKRPPKYSRAFNPQYTEKAAPTLPEPEVTEPLLIDGKPITIRTCNDKTCKWPLGDAHADMMMCGRPPRPGSPYCGGHKGTQPQHDQQRRQHQAEKAAEAAG